MRLERLRFVAALAAAASILVACNGGGMSGIPATSGIPDSGDGSQMPQPYESMTPPGGGPSMPESSGTPTVVTPNNPMMPEQPEAPISMPSPAAATTPESSPTPVASATPSHVTTEFRPSAKSPNAGPYSVTVHLNEKKIPARSYLWFVSTFELHGGSTAGFKMQDSQITIAGHTYAGPMGVVNVTPGASKAAVTVKNNAIVSSFPPALSKKAFANGLIVYLPSGLPAHQVATWTARFQSSKATSSGASIRWQATASAYSRFSPSYGSLKIDPSGTPENFVKYLVPGVHAAAPSTSFIVNI